MRLKFIILVLLALMITAGFVGAVSAADGDISEIIVSGISVPALGDKLVSSATTDIENVTASVSWTPKDNVFFAGKTYTATVTLNIIGDYENFTGSTNVIINNISEHVIKFENNKKITSTFSKYIESEIISGQVDISLKKPVAGETASNPTTDTDGIKEVTISWDPTISSNKFEPNKIYTAKITIITSPGYVFPDTTPRVNIEDEIVNPSDVTRESTKLTAKYVFEKTGTLSIPTVNLSLTPPVTGAQKSTSASSSTTGINNAIVTWDPAVSSTYEVGKTYKGTITITTKDGYVFSENTVVNINDIKIASGDVKKESDTNTDTYTKLIVNKTFPTTVSNTISEVIITGLTAPVYGATPVTKSSLTSSTGTTIKSIIWTPTVSSKFEADSQYTANIIIETSSSSYKFSSQKPSVKIGDTTVTASDVTRNSDTNISFKYTFSRTTSLKLPTITFSANQITGMIPLDVTFTYDIKDSTSQSITYGDGTSSESLSSINGTKKHTYSTAGKYTAKITATNTNGTVTKEIAITPKAGVLNAFFTYSPSTGNVPLTVYFTDGSEGTVSSRSWDFGGYGTSSEKSPSFTFTVPGAHTVKLTIKDSSGTEDTYSQTIVIQAAKSDTVSITEESSVNNENKDTNSSIPNPIGIIQELVKLFLSIFDFNNYVMAETPATAEQ